MMLRKWYQLLLFLPLAMPVLVWIINLYFGPMMRDGEYDPPPLSFGKSWWDIFSGFVLAAVFLGGLQYVAFIIGMLKWWKGKPLSYIKKTTWLLPLIFYPVCALGFIIYALILTMAPGAIWFDIILGFTLSAYCIPIGYAYVALAHALTFAVRKTGWVRD
jgi:hypothetical protein